MSRLKIDCSGLSYQEAQQLAEYLRAVEGVERVSSPSTSRDQGVNPSTGAAIDINAAIEHLRLLVRVAESTVVGGAGLRLGAKVADAVYKKVGDAIIDKVWEWVKTMFSAERAAEVKIRLYGADGKLIKKTKRKR